MTLLFLAFGLPGCAAPSCPEGEEFDVEGLCVPAPTDTGAGGGGGGPDTGSGPDSGETAEIVDTGETADTGSGWGERPREVAAVDTFSTTGWLGSGAVWRGLSVAPDGSVWAASSSGLLHLDPGTGSGRVYTTADGLMADDVRAVLAHSDGTVWVGYAGTVDRQGDQFAVEESGALAVLRVVDYTESSEQTGAYRMREQPFGVGAGDVWMGMNEGLCVWDADLAVFAEHAHPTHPHGITPGIAFSEEGDIWGGDGYQLARWRYSNDGDLSPSADLLEYWVPWPVEPEVPVEIEDADAGGGRVWLASFLFGLARVDVAEAVGSSTTTLYSEVQSAAAVRVVDPRTVVVAASDGLWVVDLTLGGLSPLAGAETIPGPVQQLAREEPAGDGSFWAAAPGELVHVELTPPG